MSLFYYVLLFDLMMVVIILLLFFHITKMYLRTLIVLKKPDQVSQAK